jgi:hypothetical protein|tara:strand:- start:368 stop:1171 length:804 start_codon:yes stop_codon:yes gene_type:complete
MAEGDGDKQVELAGVTDFTELAKLLNVATNATAVSNSAIILGDRQVDRIGTNPADIAMLDGIVPQETQAFTNENLQAYVTSLDNEELLTLQQGLFSDGFYGQIESIEEIEDPLRMGQALYQAVREAGTAFQYGAAEGMDAAPTLDGAYADFGIEDFNAAKDKYLSDASPTISVLPATAVDRMVTSTYQKLLGRKPTTAEKRTGFDLVRSAQLESGKNVGTGGIQEQLDVTGILETSATEADPDRALAIRQSATTSAIQRVLRNLGQG